MCITTPCHAFGQRQGHTGGVIAGTKWELPQAPALQHDDATCPLAIGYPSTTIQCTHRLTALWLTSSSTHSAPLVRITAPLSLTEAVLASSTVHEKLPSGPYGSSVVLQTSSMPRRYVLSYTRPPAVVIMTQAYGLSHCLLL